MNPSVLRRFVLSLVVIVAASQPAMAQTPAPEARPAADGKPAAAADAGKDAAKQAEVIAEASQTLSGPAANAECTWLGQRVVGLLWRDDLDTAFRHLDVYDRFGCPGTHVQMSFRCVVKQGTIDPKAAETLSARVHACWLNPAIPPTPAVAAAPAPGGTTTK